MKKTQPTKDVAATQTLGRVKSCKNFGMIRQPQEKYDHVGSKIKYLIDNDKSGKKMQD